MSRVLLIVAFVVGFVVAPVFGQELEIQKPEQQAPSVEADGIADITGIYECHGINPDGTSYQGVVEIWKNGDTYRLTWVFGGGTKVFGIGVLSGNMFAVSTFGDTTGVVLYKVEEGSRLIGEWTALGLDGKTYSETLTKLEQPPLPQSPPSPQYQRQEIRWPTTSIA